MQPIPTGDEDAVFYQVGQDVSLRVAMLATKGNIKMVRNTFRENFTMKVLDEELFTIYIGMVFEPLHYLYKPFNDIILRLVQCGLIDYWMQLFSGTIYKNIAERSKPVVLTWDHLYVGFYIYLVCLALSAAGFFAEILYFRLNFFIRRWILARMTAITF